MIKLLLASLSKLHEHEAAGFILFLFRDQA